MTKTEQKLFIQFLKDINLYGAFKKTLKKDLYTDYKEKEINFGALTNALNFAASRHPLVNLLPKEMFEWNNYQRYKVKDIIVPKYATFTIPTNGNITWRDINTLWYHYIAQIEGKKVYKFFKELIAAQDKYLYVNTKTNNVFKFSLKEIDTDKSPISNAILTSKEITKNMSVKTHISNIQERNNMYVSTCNFNHFLERFEPIPIEKVDEKIKTYYAEKLKKIEAEYEKCKTYFNE